MARIKNIELPANKHICIGLTAIYGIGRSLGETICKDANVEKSKVQDIKKDYQFVVKELQEMQELVKVKEKLLQIRRKQLNSRRN